MGFFSKLFKDNKANEQPLHCDELIRFIRFARKVKPLMGGNYGLNVTYTAPASGQSYIGDIWMEFGFYDFDDLRFARDCALQAQSNPIMKSVAIKYYNDIAEKAQLESRDWPFGMDEYDFLRWITNTDTTGFYFLYPDQYNDDIFKMKIKGGIDSRNAIQVCNALMEECTRVYPGLNVKKTYADSKVSHFTITI